MRSVRRTPLQLAAERGHKWYALSEKCPPDEQVRLSKWKNQDQNSNQVQHEIELIREIQSVCIAESAVATEASVGSIAYSVNQKSPVKLTNSSLYSMCHFVLTIGADHPCIERICCFHALAVNPKELALLHTVYDAVAHQLGKDHKHLAAAVIMAGYSPEIVNVNARPTPDHCRLFLPSGIKNLVANKS